MRIILSLILGLSLPLLGGSLEFEKDLVEVTVPLDGQKVTAEFEFKNRSDEEVEILRHASTCDCTSVEVKDHKMKYAPGESGIIRGIFDMANFAGTVDKSVQVWLKGDPEDLPSVVLTARIHIPKLVEIEPATLRWEVGAKPVSQTISIDMKYKDPIHVTSVESVNPRFEVELVTLEKGRKYALVVTPKDTDEQRIGLISIVTDCPVARHARQRAYTVVRKPVAPSEEP